MLNVFLDLFLLATVNTAVGSAKEDLSIIWCNLYICRPFLAGSQCNPHKITCLQILENTVRHNFVMYYRSCGLGYEAGHCPTCSFVLLTSPLTLLS